MLTALAGLGLAAATNAQTMTFSWESSHGGKVRPGEVVRLDLIADWDPPNVGLAGSVFSIYDTSGGSAFFGGGSTVVVNRSDHLDDFADPPTMEDSDGDGRIDVIDNVDVFQLPAFFNPDVWRRPVTILTIEWTVGHQLGPVSLRNNATLDGRLTADVYIDTFGTSIPYTRADETLDLLVVPGPASLATLGSGVLAALRRRPDRRSGTPR